MPAIERDLPHVSAPADLKATPDDRCLSLMTKCVFQAGFNWRVIENKWPDFETVFHGFDPHRMAFLDDEAIEVIGRDVRIVRNMAKIVTVPANARFVLDVSREHGGFGRFLAEWPPDDLVGLWTVLKKKGARLGGNTGQYFLRFIGKDAFILSRDVITCLQRSDVLEVGPATSRKALQSAQDAFNQWHEETGMPYTHLSRIAALSVGPH